MGVGKQNQKGKKKKNQERTAGKDTLMLTLALKQKY